MDGRPNGPGRFHFHQLTGRPSRQPPRCA